MTSIKKNTCFRGFTSRAIQRRLPLVATLRRSRDLGGGANCPPPPSTGRIARQTPTGRGLSIRALFDANLIRYELQQLQTLCHTSFIRYEPLHTNFCLRTVSHTNILFMNLGPGSGLESPPDAFSQLMTAGRRVSRSCKVSRRPPAVAVTSRSEDGRAASGRCRSGPPCCTQGRRHRAGWGWVGRIRGVNGT